MIFIKMLEGDYFDVAGVNRKKHAYEAFIKGMRLVKAELNVETHVELKIETESV